MMMINSATAAARFSSRRWMVRNLATAQGTRSNLPKSPQPSMPKGSIDPNYLAQERIEANIGNLSGIEAVQAMPFQIRAQNVATAAALIGFVASVWYYSMAKVGGSMHTDEPLSQLMHEANAASVKKEKQAEREQENLAHLELEVEDGMELALAAPGEIADQEEAAVAKPKSSRSMLNRVVFFWK